MYVNPFLSNVKNVFEDLGFFASISKKKEKKRKKHGSVPGTAVVVFQLINSLSCYDIVST